MISLLPAAMWEQEEDFFQKRLTCHLFMQHGRDAFNILLLKYSVNHKKNRCIEETVL
jgi:hypothetical protein